MKCIKSLAFIFITILLLMHVQMVNAQSTEIHPVPQKIKWSDTVAFDNSNGYTITGESEADSDAIELFKKHFSCDGNIELIIGERGDAVIKEYESLIPQKSEGYYLSVEGKRVIIAGNDGSGTYYGVQSYIQIASQPQVMEVSITDYPSVPKRGLVEGFYGNPYSEANRMSLFELFGRQKMNIYIYGPKDDAYHKSKWREEYPTELGAKITQYVNAAKAHKIDFVWAIHPGEDIQWNDTDRNNIVNKLKAMCRLGVRNFAVFWDDLWNDDGTHGDEQAELMNYIATEIEAEYPDVNPMIICPTQYNRGWSNGVYLPALGSIMNSDINIMWTGNSVVDMINKSDVTWINNQISRKAFIWLNYPVTDYCIDHLLMGPTHGNDTDIANLLSGFVSNPMEYAEASKVSLFSIGDYTWNMGAYNSDESWEAAIKYIMPTNAKYFRHFCENNIDLGSNVHGLRRMNESPGFVAAKEIFDRKITEGDTIAACYAIGEEFQRLTTSANTLLNSDEARALIDEITPWILSMKYLGMMGGKIVEMYFALDDNNPEQFIESYIEYTQYEEAHKDLRSRNFDGSLRVAKPAVGSLYVEPFIKEQISNLVALYKSQYDYRLDVFPAQSLENGTYHIMYKGMYLTNNSPGTSGSAPVFLQNRNETHPQRQEWHIEVDPTTKRYKIINHEDNRYLNENGAFTVSDATNPYEAVWHTYNIYLLANGKYAIQNGGNAGDNLWSVSGIRIQKSSNSTIIPPRFIFDIVPLGGKANDEFINNDEVYYIIVDGKYLTNTNVNGSGEAPRFIESDRPGIEQEWKITTDKNGLNCYKITSNADGRFINEIGDFGVKDYHSNWNTYLITVQGDKFSIQLTQLAGTSDFWVSNGERFENKTIDRSDSYTISIVKKGTGETGITETAICTTSIHYDKEAELLSIGGLSGKSRVTITAPDGSIIEHRKSSESNLTISMTECNAGIYIVVIESNGERRIEKLLKL